MDSVFPDLYVIRHGQTEWNVARRHQGRLDSPLTEKGQTQARDMGQMLSRRVAGRMDIQSFSSPQGRALHTAQIALTPLGWQVTQDARLCEVSYGAWEGLTRDEIDAGWPEQAAYAEQNPVEWNFSSPGGEGLHDLKARADSFLRELTGPAIVFTHGVLSRVLRAQWLGLNEYEMLELPGGQGIIFHLSSDGGHRVIEK
ncbi:histidine phosphatase family protein [Aliiroseovarius sp. F20344]|uniref:histidine phosphatase family protein n=1 Tax=Aliiroseovarius sp. F20344 TaxID=2926414 RepID=UPI001FF1560E|nr:histidine phosphatase family protein [Aliiroseovarius sp. F20344]MCK0143333.1 histidine phosphatase family protein [Aliiroseovarius sp. F20344]